MRVLPYFLFIFTESLRILIMAFFQSTSFHCSIIVGVCTIVWNNKSRLLSPSKLSDFFEICLLCNVLAQSSLRFYASHGVCWAFYASIMTIMSMPFLVKRLVSRPDLTNTSERFYVFFSAQTVHADKYNIHVKIQHGFIAHPQYSKLYMLILGKQ